jgi:hypothetical protein
VATRSKFARVTALIGITTEPLLTQIAQMNRGSAQIGGTTVTLRDPRRVVLANHQIVLIALVTPICADPFHLRHLR